MATWKSQNSMLTQRGVEILNKLKAGIGSINVTRIVAGSGRVSESQLYLQTTVSGDVKEMNLSSINTSDSGSEINFYISNADFTAPFTVQQLGVYVTHPDYSGEQLYHISQCDANGADTLPVSSETQITQWYSIYMEHGNSSSITLTVDPTGVVSREEFSSLTKNAIPGNFVTVDENGKIVDTGVSITDAGGSSRDLVHNGYFFNPVDTKNGMYFPQGQSYYSDKFLNTRVGSSTEPLPVVRIDGTSAEVVISGTTYYVNAQYCRRGYVAPSGSNTIVCLDRWFLKSSDSSSHVEKDDRGIYLTLSKNGGAFYQNIASIVSPAKYGGKKYTITAKIEQASTGDPVIFIDNGKETFEVSPDPAYSGYYYVTGTIDADSTAFRVGIKNNSTANFTYVRVTAIKVEVGEKTTLVKDPPADKAEQAAICIQYDPTTDEYVGFTSSATANILAVATITE